MTVLTKVDSDLVSLLFWHHSMLTKRHLVTFRMCRRRQRTSTGTTQPVQIVHKTNAADLYSVTHRPLFRYFSYTKQSVILVSFIY